MHFLDKGTEALSEINLPKVTWHLVVRFLFKCMLHWSLCAFTTLYRAPHWESPR